jgi:diguanylate cyclase (GGDEF)-like protein
MLMLDVDKFKNYNDTYGHPQGDLLLQFVGKTLIACLRRTSDMAARYGGDEFAVLLGDTDAAGAAVVAEQIRAAIEAGRVPRVGPDGSMADTSVTVSIGINALVPSLDAEMGDFVQGADQNLYIAKDTGRNRVVG